MQFYAAASEHLGPQVLAVLAPHKFAPSILFTLYPFIMGIKAPALLRHVIRSFADRQTIVDSGLFTLVMQGTFQTKNGPDIPAYRDYAEKYLKILQNSEYRGVFVDLDCQMLVGRKVHEEIREQFLPHKERCIFVWHPATQLDGLRWMLKNCSRIGFSGRELKNLANTLKLHNNSVEDVALSLIRKCGGDIDTHHVHLFGTTQESMFRMPDNWTCDSVSWSAVAFWGRSHSGQRFEVHDAGKGVIKATPHILQTVGQEMPVMLAAYRDSPEYKRKNPPRLKYVRMIAAGLYAQQLTVQAWRQHYHACAEASDPILYVKGAKHHGKEKQRVLVGRR